MKEYWVGKSGAVFLATSKKIPPLNLSQTRENISSLTFIPCLETYLPAYVTLTLNLYKNVFRSVFFNAHLKSAGSNNGSPL